MIRKVIKLLKLYHTKITFIGSMRFMVTSRSKLVDYLSEIYSEKCRDKNCNTAQKIKFSIKNFFSKCDQVSKCDFYAVKGILRTFSNIYDGVLCESN